MNNEIMRQTKGDGLPISARQDRQGYRQGRQVVTEVRLAGLRIDGALALAAHSMTGLVELDDLRRRLAKDDVSQNMILSEIEEVALQQVRALQQSLYNEWGL